ncbi:5,6-dimethylbenzimidazole synthase [Paracoccus sp. (in: a-proteobacteria)]|uniref:5,6-dimethylbenzimidazole synthase n=1 Tax=Paracoccus sp. TaxID=267 RepID=UPI0026DF6CA8|nr:5,6-dimethylbenzimidazole synthase [Paracoccus sp. (in: a-proteobacteria)]MDO5647796.1 5,6-dimethylbenzimidazole synthase [Paracoccus sp. (in: a-proteobacteria)]
MQFSSADHDALMTLLAWRRDVRHFRPDPVPEPMIARLEAAMRLAPSVGNARPWRVIRVDDPAIRAAVRDDFAACNAAAAGRYQGDKRAEYTALKLAGLDAAPVQLAVFCVDDPAQGHGLGRQTMPHTLMQSVSMAVFALWLSARAQNLGVGMVSILNPDRITALLDTPPDWRFAAWLCIGWPERSDDTPLLHRTGWQENDDAPWLKR